MTTTPVHRRRNLWILAGLAIAAIVVVAGAFLASGDPDGLVRVATDKGFLGAEQENPFQVIAGYAFPGLEGPAATIVAGLIGVAVLFALVWLVGKALARRHN